MYKWCAWWRASAIMMLTIHQLHDDVNRARGYRIGQKYCHENLCNERVVKVYRQYPKG